MRWSRVNLITTREAPSDAEVVSHRLMVRSGLIRKVAAGIYSYLPMGWRSVRKLEAIVRREMEAAGAVELSMPAIQPAELWQESGRWAKYGRELLRIEDRHQRDFCFGPTHEEVVTDIVRRDVKSYRQLPLNLYQIQTKFRDEIRPRFGLMRGREFIMKDAYSFHADLASLEEAYRAMYDAYCRIFEACDLRYAVVEADSGAIGGATSHEFIVVAETGESEVVRCPNGDYGANVEKAVTRLVSGSGDPADGAADMEEVATPGASTVEEVTELLGIGPERIVKTLLYETIGRAADGEAVAGLAAAAVRGDRAVNEVKLAKVLDVEHLTLASEEAVRRVTGAPVGFAGPVGLGDGIRLVADETVRGMRDFVCGANRADAHLRGVNWGRDAEPTEWADILLVRGGDPCPRDGGTLEQSRGIEVGHIFQLGDIYSEAMGCLFLDETGTSHAMLMGCYGLGIGRTVAAAIEQGHDDDGIVWPRPLAPFEVLLIALNPDDESVAQAGDRLYGELVGKGVDVLYDDRDERPGVKFKDADLIGVPLRIVVGARSLTEGSVELSLRSERRERVLCPVGEAVSRGLEMLDRG
jgi:prolyl-tRNA synthetase